MRIAVILVIALVATYTLASSRTYLERGADISSNAERTAGWLLKGRASPDTRLQLHMFVRQQNLETLEKTLYEVSDPDHIKYGKHLSHDEVNALTAPGASALLSVVSFLEANGVDVQRQVSSTPNGDILEVNTDVATAEKLLETEYYTYEHMHSKSTIVRTPTAYSLPSEVAQHVDFVGPTIRFPTMSKLRVSAPTPQAGGVTPSFLRQLYNIGDVVSKSPGNTQAVTGFLEQYISLSDLQTFFQQYSPSQSGTQPNINGPNQQGSPGVEASLDIQYVMGVGQGVNTTFWSTAGRQPGNQQNEPFLKFLFDVANTTDAPSVISISYGDNEGSVELDYAIRVNTEFQKAGTRGLSIMASSGDGGVSGGQSGLCKKFIPTYPSASPYILSVGGTTGSNPEVAASFSSGGFSNRWARPSWQDSFVTKYFSVAQGLPPSDLYNHTSIGFPDVSAQAENFAVVVGGFAQPVDGTSCSSPTFAGVVALLNDLRLQQGKSTLGFLPPLFYKNPQAFNDVTQGNNPGCFTNGFPAAPGWDPVTGLGTPDYKKLASIVTALP